MITTAADSEDDVVWAYSRYPLGAQAVALLRNPLPRFTMSLEAHETTAQATKQ